MNLHTKSDWRAHLKELRRAISPERKREAAQTLLKELSPLLSPFSHVLSFCSLPEEIDTALLNDSLEAEGKLLLPKVEKDLLAIYRVTHRESQLAAGPRGLKEPLPHLCAASSLNEIDCILLPGLGFDSKNCRIGYGKGHYDKFISALNAISHYPLLIGIGFREQKILENIPCEEHDATMHLLALG